MSRVLVTGSSGFVGQVLSERLSSQGHSVIKLDIECGDIADPDVFKVFLNEEIHHIFHLAARTYVPDSWVCPFDFYQTNVMGTENVLEFCRRKKISLTYVSAYVYGYPDELPIKEEHPVRPNNHYAQSKYLAEQLCEFYAKHHHVRTRVIRPFNIYGLAQNAKFLIPHIIHQVLKSDVIKVKDLHPRRDYVYIEDIVDALMCTLKPAVDFSVYNIGSGYSVSVKEIIDTVQNVVGTKKPVESENIVRQNELADVVADISRAWQELEWKPKHDFRAGIEAIIGRCEGREAS